MNLAISFISIVTGKNFANKIFFLNDSYDILRDYILANDMTTVFAKSRVLSDINYNNKIHKESSVFSKFMLGGLTKPQFLAITGVFYLLDLVTFGSAALIER